MAVGTEVGLGPGHIVLDGDPVPLPKKGRNPQFSAHFSCGQTAGCIKMPLGMEVGFSPDDCVRWGPSYSRKKGTLTPTQFWLVSIVAKRLDG